MREKPKSYSSASATVTATTTPVQSNVMNWFSQVDACRRLTPVQLARCMPGCIEPGPWAFDDVNKFFGVRDMPVLPAKHESADLNHLEENLNYSVWL